MKVALPLAKNVLAPLGLAASMSAIDGSIQKKIHGSGVKLIIEQEDLKDIMKIIKKINYLFILKLNLDLMAYILEIIYQIKLKKEHT